MVLVLFTWSDNALHFTNFCQSISKDFRFIHLNIRVDARLVANVDDGRTDGQTNGRKTGSLYRTMHELAGDDKNKCKAKTKLVKGIIKFKFI